MGARQAFHTGYSAPSTTLSAEGCLVQAGCGQVLICPLEVAVHSLTHREPCFLFSAMEIVWEKNHFLGQHEDYPVEDPGNINYCY